MLSQKLSQKIKDMNKFVIIIIIFTEICFYPETSILLQIIRIIHMTFRIMPEFDR